MCDASNRPIRLIGTVQDITERKLAEEALLRSHKQLLSFIEHAPVSIAMFDREMRYLVNSRRWVADYGLGLSDLTGRSHYDVLPDLPERWKGVHRRGLAGETLRNDNDLWTRVDGTETWLRWVVLPWRDGRGEIGGIVIFTEDVTERKRTEEVGRVLPLKELGALRPQGMSLPPDGRFVAYDRPQADRPGMRDIFILATDGGGEWPLVEHPANDLFPQWTPDGERVLYASNRTGALGLWMVSVTDSRPLAWSNPRTLRAGARLTF